MRREALKAERERKLEEAKKRGKRPPVTQLSRSELEQRAKEMFERAKNARTRQEAWIRTKQEAQKPQHKSSSSVSGLARDRHFARLAMLPPTHQAPPRPRSSDRPAWFAGQARETTRQAGPPRRDSAVH